MFGRFILSSFSRRMAFSSAHVFESAVIKSYPENPKDYPGIDTHHHMIICYRWIILIQDIVRDIIFVDDNSVHFIAATSSCFIMSTGKFINMHTPLFLSIILCYIILIIL